MRSVSRERGGQGVLRGDGQHSPPAVCPSEPGRFAQPFGGISAPMFGQLLDEPDCLRAVRDGTGSSEGKTANGRRLAVEELAQRGPSALPAMQ